MLSGTIQRENGTGQSKTWIRGNVTHHHRQDVKVGRTEESVSAFLTGNALPICQFCNAALRSGVYFHFCGERLVEVSYATTCGM
jgi:hypothetical protein